MTFAEGFKLLVPSICPYTDKQDSIYNHLELISFDSDDCLYYVSYIKGYIICCTLFELSEEATTYYTLPQMQKKYKNLFQTDTCPEAHLWDPGNWSDCFFVPERIRALL